MIEVALQEPSNQQTQAPRQLADETLSARPNPSQAAASPPQLFDLNDGSDLDVDGVISWDAAALAG
jgi:hypothetical protein